MALRLNGSSSGYVELDVPADAGSHTLTLPDGGGSSGQYLQTNGSGALSWQTVTDTNLTRVNAVDTSSGDGDSTNTAVVFDNIPSTARRISISFWNVSGNATTDLLRILVRTGSGTDVTSGYYSVATALTSSGGSSAENRNNSFLVWNNVAAERTSGVATLTNIEDNKWVFNASGAFYSNYSFTSGGYIDVGATVTGIKVYLGNGNDFDSGRIGLTYEV